MMAILLASGLFGQRQEIDLEQFAERLFQVQEAGLSYEDLYESLLLNYANPLQLNTATYEALASLYILTPAQLSDFFAYKAQFGNLLDVHELQAIPSFDLATIYLLLPFVTVAISAPDNRPFVRRLLEEENNYFLIRYSKRLQQQVGYTAATPLDTSFVRNPDGAIVDTITSPPRRYLGSPEKVYGRFRTSRKGDFSVGFTFEKDPGEQLSFSRQQKGFDFYSYHFLLENKLKMDQIILGDFQLQVGQGIVFGAGFNPGKGSATVTSAKRSTMGIRPYTSVLESGFFRGVGVSKSLGAWELTACYSRLPQDGKIRTDTTFSAFDEYVNSIQTTGLHRTQSELENRDMVTEQKIGGILRYAPDRRHSLGIATLRIGYSTPLLRTENNYNQFEFRGDRNHVTSLFGHYTWQNFTFFGEAARSSSGGLGAVAGSVGTLSKSVDLAMILRSYARDFHSPYGSAFSENSRAINEKGVYWGLAIKPNRRHIVHLYYDHFRFPWLKYRVDAPSGGNEWLIRYTYRPTRKISCDAQVRKQRRQVSVAKENLSVLVDQVKDNYLFALKYDATQDLVLKTRVQSSQQEEGGELSRGIALAQDANFRIGGLRFYTRMALFDTDNFENSQYVYERDVLYSFSIPAYNGRGVRNYAMLRYDPLANLSLWIRYAQTRFLDRETVGSGLEAAYGDTISEIKLMARWQL